MKLPPGAHSPRSLLRSRRWLLFLLGLAAVFTLILIARWKLSATNSPQSAVEPFRIAGNLYYVGSNVAASFLLTSPQGHVLIDGGHPDTPPLILRSVAALGFHITDIKVLLNSHAHRDHAGGLAALQKASGAQLWISEGDAPIVAAGGAADPIHRIAPALSAVRCLPLRDAARSFASVLSSRFTSKYSAPRIDHRFRDGDIVRLGPLELTAHITAGHTPGCTSWDFRVNDGHRHLRAVSICGLALLPYMSLVEPKTYPAIRDDFERSFKTLRHLPADIFLAQEPGDFQMHRKLQQRAYASDPATPFIDPAGYRTYVDNAEKHFHEQLANQLRRP